MIETNRNPNSAVTAADVDVELQRIIRRWHELPAARAEELVPQLRQHAQQLLDAARRRRGQQAVPLPRMGADGVLSQLRVAVYDAREVGVDEFELADRLRALRRTVNQ